MTQGWVCVHRKLLEWEWFDDHNTFRLFMYFILKANHKDKKWKGILIKRGQHLSSLDAICAGSGLTKSQVRTSIKKLKSTHEIAHESTKQHTVITVINYDLYQSYDTHNSTPVARESHTSDTPVTPNNNVNNENKKPIDQDKLDLSKYKLKAFDHWWDKYPRKIGKQSAVKSWLKVVKKMDGEKVKALTNHICEDIKTRMDSLESGSKDFFGFDTLHAATYLNGARYNDDI